MKIRMLAITAALGLALPTLALADTTPSKTADKTVKGDNKMSDKTSGDKTSGEKMSADDTKIISHLHHVNQMEIDLGKWAQKSGTAGVKTYGESLVTDHTSSDKDLTALAKQHGVSSIPADKPTTDADRQDEKDMTISVAKLKTLKGAEFDREFLTMMASGHDKELAKIDTSIGAATNSDLQALLKTVKPVLQRHADQARDLQKNSPQASTTSTR